MTLSSRLVPDLTLRSSLGCLKGVGPSRAALLASAGWRSVGDLLRYLPFRYEDRRHRAMICDIDSPGRFGLQGRIRDLKLVRIRRRRLTLVRGVLEDDSGRLAVAWFNRPYLARQIEPEGEYTLYGEVRLRGSRLELLNPALERTEPGGDDSRILPFYQAVPGLRGGLLRSLICQAMTRCDLAALQDELPADLLREHRLPSLAEALQRLHLPGGQDDLSALNEGRTSAHWRLAYGEFLELQTELAFLRGLQTQTTKPHHYRSDPGLEDLWQEIVPFRLTAAQLRVLREIRQDLLRPSPMLRLLQGDVGSGKTIVAVLALVTALESGLQGAFMAPTELLAEQHYRSLRRLLGERYRVSLLTSSVEGAREIRAELAAGEAQLAIGTHALIQDGTEFARLGLAIIDEQHRFGVAQRRLLQDKGNQPDVLVMTATPIPRSLALTVYGDLSLSIIDELPPGRQPVVTRVVTAEERGVVYRWIREKIDSGLQAYIVFPLIEESDQLKAESIASTGEEVRRYLGIEASAVIHGRTSSEQRHEIMQRFAAGTIRVLVATTVIEVGVDVPDARLMVIESGERFGLSQLHQLRGRVGRGEGTSWCVVLHGGLSEEAKRRLEVFAQTRDGFRIAEADLEIRGPGDLLGTRQSGLPVFRSADIIRHQVWLERARRDARRLIAEWPETVHSRFVESIKERAGQRYTRLAGG